MLHQKPPEIIVWSSTERTGGYFEINVGKRQPSYITYTRLSPVLNLLDLHQSLEDFTSHELDIPKYLRYFVKMKHHISYLYNALLEYYPLHQAWYET